ncbi:MAG: peptidase S41 [Anaerolineae bacterium]|nr:peptidase S41 [Anaerolineae bacterium]
MKHRILWIVLLVTASLALAACILTAGPKDTPEPDLPLAGIQEEVCGIESCPTAEVITITADATDPEAPVMIKGSFDYTNEFYPEDYAEEHAVGLFDMTGFILRDDEYVIPVNSQVLGYADVDEDNNTATYSILLPAAPQAPLNDVDQNEESNAGVQIFAVEYAPNWTGGPFYADDDEYWGWPGYLASVVTDSENDDEIIGGKLIIWAPDGAQSFPSGFGADGLLFTADDPLMTVPAGYSVIDLDQDPFALIREPIVEIDLLEPDDAAIKDFSDMSYTEAFDAMFEIVSKEYAFNGIPGKQPDWEQLYAEIRPRVEAAEPRDAYNFYLAMREFALAFNDGHVGLDGGDQEGRWVQEAIYGGFGFAIRELDDGRSIVVYILPDGPADRAGMQVGAEILEFKGLPIADAISQTEPYGPQSTDFGLRYEQTVFVGRAPVNTRTEVKFINPGDTAPITADVTAEIEFDSLWATYLGGEYDEYVLPIEYRILPDEWIGYIKVNSNSDDLNLSYRIFERALKSFEEAGVVGLIIDMRLNFGGTPFNFAGYLTDQEIPMGQLQYYNENSGEFEGDDEPTIYTPYENQYTFDKMVLLVDQFCFSACELDAYALSQVPGMVVIGEFPTAGVEAETARGNFDLPAGISFGVPTGRFINEDGTIFLEGVGVVPDIDLPVTEESVLSEEDVVLQRAIEEILNTAQ